MWLTRVVSCLSRVVNLVSRIINGVGVGILAIMMLFTVTDISLRYFLNRPIASSFELTEFMMAIIICFGLAYTGILKGHIAIELVVSRLPQRARAVINSITNLVSVCVFSLITWQSFVQAKTLSLSGLTSSVLYIPVSPFLIMTGFGFAVLTLVFLIDFLNSVSQAVRK